MFPQPEMVAACFGFTGEKGHRSPKFSGCRCCSPDCEAVMILPWTQAVRKGYIDLPVLRQKQWPCWHAQGGFLSLHDPSYHGVYYWGYMGIMEKKMETTILYSNRVYVGIIVLLIPCVTIATGPGAHNVDCGIVSLQP